jgi:alkyl sulfatase BDS1-like metallo-beta-lactamase superfamily hydrolase
VTLNRADLNQVMMGVASFDDLLVSGKARFEGDRNGFDRLRSILSSVHANFEILPGIPGKVPTPAPKPFEVRDLLEYD